LNDTNPVQRLILTHHETHFTHSVVHEYETKPTHGVFYRHMPLGVVTFVYLVIPLEKLITTKHMSFY